MIDFLNRHSVLVKQIMRFGVVGLSASFVHFCVVVFLVQTYFWVPLLANIAGFMTGFQVSYWGHRRFTFSGTDVLHRVALPKILLIQFANFAANESLFYFFLKLHLPYAVALLIVLTVLPIFTFVTSKFWVFE